MHLRLQKKFLALVLATVLCLSLAIPVAAASISDAAVTPPYESTVCNGKAVDAHRSHGGLLAQIPCSKTATAHRRLSQHPQIRRTSYDHQQYLQFRPPGENKT